MVKLGWIVVSSILGIIDICRSFEIGDGDFTWPGSTWDGPAVGYGHPGWELPLTDHPAPLLPLELSAPFETSVVHNHYHHIVGGGGGLPPHEGLINGQLYQHPPTGHHHQGGHHHHQPTRDWYCHHAKKVKHLKKWLAKMLFCSLVF